MPVTTISPAPRLHGVHPSLAIAEHACPAPRTTSLRKGPVPRCARRAAAVVEFAVCLPVLVLLVTGAMELTNVIYLKQSLTATAYEGVREAVRPEASLASAQAIANRILIGHRVRNGNLTVTPSVTVPRGQRLTATASAPINDNRVIIPRYVAGVSLSASATMLKE